MREIKFRAWSKLDKQMIVHNPIDTKRFIIDMNGNIGCMDLDTMKWSGIIPDQYVEIMRYTGLKDKNGKEIYEGDILERKFSGLGNELGDRTFVSWDRYRFVQNWVMKFKRNLKNSADLGKWFKSQKQFKLDLDAHLNDFEVVGNIYENPELLKG